MTVPGVWGCNPAKKVLFRWNQVGYLESPIWRPRLGKTGGLQSFSNAIPLGSLSGRAGQGRVGVDADPD